MNVAIVGGAGGVGSSAAFALAFTGVVHELLLVDPRAGLARSHAMDLEQLAVRLDHPWTVGTADIDAVIDADVVVVTASTPHRDGASRSAHLAANLDVFEALMREVGDPAAIRAPVVVATNPVDPLCQWLFERHGLSRERVIGFTLNDSTRLRFAVARALNVPAHEVEAWCIGAHGEGHVPLSSRLRVKGEPVELTLPQRHEADAYMDGWYDDWQACQSGRTSTWMSGCGIADVVGALARKTPTQLVASVPLDGEYGISGTSVSVPVRLDGRGARVVEWDLSDDELAALRRSAGAVRRALDSCAHGTVGAG